MPGILAGGRKRSGAFAPLTPGRVHSSCPYCGFNLSPARIDGSRPAFFMEGLICPHLRGPIFSQAHSAALSST